LLKIAFISKPAKTRVFPGFFSQLPETWVLKFCPELETLMFNELKYSTYLMPFFNIVGIKWFSFKKLAGY